MTRQINFSVDDRVYATLEKQADKHGYKATAYAKALFEAAYASRCGVQPDPELDDQVAATIVLHGARKDSAAIAKIVRLSESTVVSIIDMWRRERLAA
jgi:hypothetical protein